MASILDNQQRIITAIIKLVKTMPFDKLSVLDICAEAGISKQTFYRTFPDKYHAAIWYINGSNKVSCQRIGFDLSWRQGFLRHFVFIERNRDIMKKFHGSREFNTINHSVTDQAQLNFANAYRHLHGEDMPPLIAYQNKMFATLCTFAVNDWVSHDCTPSADEFVDLFLTLVPHELYEALEISDDKSLDPASIIITL